jgi:hypothetical protein
MAATNYSSRIDTTSAALVNRPFLSGRSPGNDELATWTKFFGPPPVKQQNYGEDIIETHKDLYKIYEGQNLYLSDTITGFILSDVAWETSVLPWLETDQMHITFNRFEFKNTLATPVPYEGIPRLVVNSGSTFSDSVHRLGIGFIMEADALSTPEGANMYNMNLAQISQSSMEAVKYATIVKLLVCKDYEKERQDLHRPNSQVTERIEEKECEFFGIMSVNREGLARMIEDVRATMVMQKSTPDTLILFPRAMMFDEYIAQGTYTEYWQTGPTGIAYLRAGPPAAGRYRNLVVYETREFDAYTNGLRFNPMMRRVTIGEHYLAVFGQWRGSSPLPRNYSNDWRSLQLYSIKSNDWEKVDFLTLFKHANLFGNSQTNPNDLNPHVAELAKWHNEQFATDFAAEEARYRDSNLALLDNLDGNSKSGRRVFFMLAHNAEKRRVDPVTSFGMFDIDAINTSDFLQSAHTLLDKAFPGEGDRDSVLKELNDVAELITLLEAQPYNKEYAQAIASENAAASVDSNGVFRGWQPTTSDPVDWVGNEFSGLDLPDISVNGGVDIPIGAASWGGIATLADQGEARGYNKDVVARAKKAAAVIRRTTRNVNEKATGTKAFDKENAPNWNNPKLSETVTFNTMFVTRPPLMLALASDEDQKAGASKTFPAVPSAKDAKKKAAQADETGESVKIVWNPLGTTALTAALFPDIFPRVRYIDALLASDDKSTLETLANYLAGVPDTGRVVTDLDTYLFNLLDNGPAAGTNNAKLTDQKDKDKANAEGPQKAENARQSLINAIIAVIDTADKPELAPSIVAQLKDWAAKLSKTKSDATPENVATLVTQLTALADSASKKARKDVGAMTKADQDKQIALGEILLSFKVGTGVPLTVDGGKVRTTGGLARRQVLPFLAEALPAINKKLLTPVSTKAGSSNPLKALAKIAEELEAEGRALYHDTGMLLMVENYAEWVDNAVQRDTLSKRQLNEVAASYTKYLKVSEEIEKRASAEYAKIAASKGSDTADADEDLDDAEASFTSVGAKVVTKAKKTGAAKVWFRSPLVNSPELMRSLAKEKDIPLMVPTDPRSNYRTAYAPWAKDTAKNGIELTLDDFVHVTADATLQETTTTSLRATAKPLVKEPRVQALLVRQPVDRFFVLDASEFNYSAKGLPITGKPGARAFEKFDINSIRKDARARGAHFGDSTGAEAADVAAAMKEINRKRLAQGLPTRDFDRDFTVASVQAEHDARMQLDAEEELAAASDLAEHSVRGSQFTGFALPSGARQGAGMIFDPITRAQKYSTSMKSTGKSSAFPTRAPDIGGWRGDIDNRNVQWDLDRNLRESELENENDEVLGAPLDFMAADPRFYGDRRWASTRGRGYVPEGYYAGEFGIDPNNPTYGLHGVYARDQRFYNRSAGGPPPDRSWPGQVAPAPMVSTDDFKEAMHPNIKYRHERAHAETDPLLRLGVVVLMQMPNNYRTWLGLIKRDIHVPINLIAWRLNIELEMNTGMMMESGLQTGANVAGKAGAAISGSVADRMVYATYVFHHATMVFTEKNIAHLQNVQFGGYIAGLDTTFVMTRSELKKDARGSLIVTAIPITENKFDSRLNFVDTTVARLLPSQTNRTKDIDSTSSTSSNRYYQEIWGYSEQYLNHTRATNRYHLQSTRVNVRSSEGKHYSHAGASGYYKLHKGQGHLAGKKMGPGVRKVLIGTNATMLDDDVDPQMRQF